MKDLAHGGTMLECHCLPMLDFGGNDAYDKSITVPCIVSTQAI